jgi:DNA polymerase-4
VRKILHVDMDAFYASVEQRDDAALRGRPIVVGGSPDGRGVVAAASYEARRFGVRSAMSSRVAARLCPDLIFVHPQFTKYQEASAHLHRILADYADAIEPLALDEAYLDVTSDKAGVGTATEAARRIRARVKEELRLTCSAGVAPLKFVAKLASEQNKPDGLFVVPPDRVLTFLRPLPVDKLWGVGPATAAVIRERLRVETIGELARLDPPALHRALGSRGPWLWELANGRDPRGVGARSHRRSHGAERTFDEDVLDVDVLDDRVSRLVERLWGDVDTDTPPKTLTVKVRYADFTTVTRSSSVEPGMSAAEAVALSRELLRRTDAGSRAVRLVGVSLHGPEERSSDARQLALPLEFDGYRG